MKYKEITLIELFIVVIIVGILISIIIQTFICVHKNTTKLGIYYKESKITEVLTVCCHCGIELKKEIINNH